jgi:nucleoside-diphosphate-sugar epimerase
MTDALIGYSGFVGGNLAKQREFSFLFNSKNFRELPGKYDLVVCAGLYAAKWLANKNPDEDRARIDALSEVLMGVDAKRFVLISTIDVYPVFEGADEDYDCHVLPNHPYGANRLRFEDFVAQHFEDHLIIRLPGLFGPGLKKNVIFDLVHNNCLDVINPESSFQYYDVSNLWNDIELLLMTDVRLVNLFTEPVSTHELLKRFFPNTTVGKEKAPSVHYNLHTKHAHLFGRQGRYVRTKNEVLSALDLFLQSYDQE